MFPGGTIALLKHVITSWQVIAVTIALVIYLQIVFYTARSYHRPREKKINVKIRKAKPEPVAGPEEIAADSSSNDELGLEED